jgi:PPOX class probable F420-dependent enzyme
MAISPRGSRLLKSARVAHLATTDSNGRPHVIPICFASDGRQLFSPLDEKPKRAEPRRLKRVRNIVANPHVALVADHYEEDWRRLGYVLVTGKARIVSRGATHKKAVKLLRRKYPQYRAMAIHERPLIVILPQRVIIWTALNSARRDQ